MLLNRLAIAAEG